MADRRLVHADDLPADVRARLDALDEPPPRSRRRALTPKSSTPQTYRCNTCNATFTAWAPAERHGRTAHTNIGTAARIELVLDP